jgi:sigma-54 specific flagellar transcriptional regulator A
MNGFQVEKQSPSKRNHPLSDRIFANCKSNGPFLAHFATVLAAGRTELLKAPQPFIERSKATKRLGAKDFLRSSPHSRECSDTLSFLIRQAHPRTWHMPCLYIEPHSQIYPLNRFTNRMGGRVTTGEIQAVTLQDGCDRLSSTHGQINSGSCYQGVIGKSRAMVNVFKLIQRVADSDSTVLINGETGTGKGLVAKAIHQSSYRKERPFVSINCGAIPENLLESELFGHVKGAFTGATNAKMGKFELANGGTIFLDEIGDMSPDLQVKVLKVLEEREFEPVGGCKTVKVDVRIVAATHRDLEEEVQKGNFREDLFYRLYVIPIHLPALRERQIDIPLLVAYFLNKLNEEKGTQIDGMSETAMRIFMGYNWPGNVRELANLMERLTVLKGEGEITADDLPEKLRGNEASIPIMTAPDLTIDGICLTTAVNEFEKNLIYQSLERTDWVKNKAAKLLQVKRTTLVEKIKRYELHKCA